MNKKLKIYSTLFVVVLVYLVVTSVVHIDSYGWGQGGHDKLEFVDEAPGFMTRDTLEGGAVRTITKPTLSYEVYVKPKNLSKQRVLLSTAKSIHQSSAGETQTYKVEMQKVKLVTPTSETSFSFHIIFAIVSALVVTIVIVWILCMVYKVIRSIRKGDIFVAQVSKYLETTGFLLTALYLFQWFFSYVFTQYCINHIQLSDYYIVYKNEANSMYILTGLALMIISQIILMGKDLKEEQDLTI